jgi:hypothetical protein
VYVRGSYRITLWCDLKSAVSAHELSETDRKRSDGLLGESDPERCCSHSAPPALHVTALLFDSTSCALRHRSVRPKLSVDI